MSDEARQDPGKQDGGQSWAPWPAAAPRRRPEQLPVPPEAEAEQAAPVTPPSPFAPPSQQPPTSTPPAQPSPFAPPPAAQQSPYAPPATAAPDASPTSAPPVAPPPEPPFTPPSTSTLPLTFESPFEPPPTSAPPAVTPTSAPPVAPPPVAATPAPPATGLPWMSSTVAAEPSYWTPAPPAPAPVSSPPGPDWEQTWSPGRSGDPLSGGPRRIPPSESEPRAMRFSTGLIIGLVVAILVGAGGYFLGAGTGHGKPAASPTPSPSLHAFEANQMALNEAKFSGDLVPLAKPWLAYLGACISDTDTGGPKLLPDETKHVFCRYGGVSVHFAQYKSMTAVSLERTYRQQLNVTTDSLAPGQEAPSRKSGAVSKAPGDYVEYALKGDDGRPLCGIWWNRDNSTGAVFMEGLCQEVLGGSWAPLRDLWQRFS